MGKHIIKLTFVVILWILWVTIQYSLWDTIGVKIESSGSSLTVIYCNFHRPSITAQSREWGQHDQGQKHHDDHGLRLPVRGQAARFIMAHTSGCVGDTPKNRLMIWGRLHGFITIGDCHNHMKLYEIIYICQYVMSRYVTICRSPSWNELRQVRSVVVKIFFF